MIRVKNLSYTYADAQSKILDNIKIVLKPGKIVLLAGPTGSGKSTLALLIAGILQRHGHGICHGFVALDGKDITSITSRDLARDLGIVFQNADLQLFHERVAEDIVFGLENLGFPPERIAASLELELNRFGLTTFGDQKICELSGGYRQRVAIAGMLAMGQRYLILDEPLAFLDRFAARGLVDLLKKIKKHIGILVIEHRTELIKEAADQVLYLSGGSIFAGNPPVVSYDRLSSCFRGAEVMRAKNISYRFAGKKEDVLKACSIKLRRGVSHVLLGDNGSGKTTLLKVMTGLYPCRKGVVMCMGLTRKGKGPFAGVGLVLQNPDHQLFMPSTAKEVHTFAADAGLAEELLAGLKLDSFLFQHPQSLSMGQKRRLALAAVLAQKPRILLLDEPTVGQDPESMKLMLAVLDRFVSDGGSLLSATHDYQAARALGRVVWLIDDGHIRKKGGPGLTDLYFSASKKEE